MTDAEKADWRDKRLLVATMLMASDEFQARVPQFVLPSDGIRETEQMNRKRTIAIQRVTLDALEQAQHLMTANAEAPT